VAVKLCNGVIVTLLSRPVFVSYQGAEGYEPPETLLRVQLAAFLPPHFSVEVGLAVPDLRRDIHL
jgi:hypothetical protein